MAIFGDFFASCIRSEPRAAHFRRRKKKEERNSMKILWSALLHRATITRCLVCLRVCLSVCVVVMLCLCLCTLLCSNIHSRYKAVVALDVITTADYEHRTHIVRHRTQLVLSWKRRTWDRAFIRAVWTCAYTECRRCLKDEYALIKCTADHDTVCLRTYDQPIHYSYIRQPPVNFTSYLVGPNLHMTIKLHSY